MRPLPTRVLLLGSFRAALFGAPIRLALDIYSWLPRCGNFAFVQSFPFRSCWHRPIKLFCGGDQLLPESIQGRVEFWNDWLYPLQLFKHVIVHAYSQRAAQTVSINKPRSSRSYISSDGGGGGFGLVVCSCFGSFCFLLIQFTVPSGMNCTRVCITISLWSSSNRA